MATLTLTPPDTCGFQKPSGSLAWLKFGLANAGAFAGVSMIAAVLYLVTSRSDHALNMAEWGRAAMAIASVPFHNGSANKPTEVAEDQKGRHNEQPAISAINNQHPFSEGAATPSQELDVGYTATNPAMTAATSVVMEAVERGDAMALLADYAAARLLYRFAAERGSADAALKLAKTYDPAFLTKNFGLRPDSAEAARWYEAADKLQAGIQP